MHLILISKGMKGGVLKAWVSFTDWLKNEDSTQKVGCLPMRPQKNSALPNQCKCTPGEQMGVLGIPPGA